MHSFSNFAASNCLVGSPKDVPDGSCLPSGSCVDSKFGNKQVPDMKGFNVCCKPKGTTGIGAPDPSCYGSASEPKAGSMAGSGGGEGCRYDDMGDVLTSTGVKVPRGDYLGNNVNNCNATCPTYFATDDGGNMCQNIEFDSFGQCRRGKNGLVKCPVHGNSGTVAQKAASDAKAAAQKAAAAQKTATTAAQKAAAQKAASDAKAAALKAAGVVAPSTLTPAGGSPAKGINPILIGLIVLAIFVAFYLFRKNRKGKTFFGKRK